MTNQWMTVITKDNPPTEIVISDEILKLIEQQSLMQNLIRGGIEALNPELEITDDLLAQIISQAATTNVEAENLGEARKANNIGYDADPRALTS